MYVTSVLSRYQRDPTALSLPLPEGPGSGILVIQDEEAQPTCCFGLRSSDEVKNLPFPQNYNLRVEYSKQSGKNRRISIDRVVFVPVINQPLSSNQYYCINRKGKHKGLAYKSMTEEDVTTCCFCIRMTDLKPKTADPHDVHQQFEIRRRNRSGFVAKSVSHDGLPPSFLRREGWTATYTTSTPYQLNEALGLDNSLRARLPNKNFSISEKKSRPVVVGKWYCPFIFIKDETLKDQMDKSRFYEMTLEQRWEQIFTCENSNNNNVIDVDVVLEIEAIEVFGEVVALGGMYIAVGGTYVENGIQWFKSRDVGLSSVIVERMKWEESRFGWTGEREVRVKRVDEYEGGNKEWKNFGCYVLVERFVLKRMHGSVVLTYDFMHPHRIITKWE